MKIHIATIVLLLIFLGAGGGKLANAPQLVENFRRWGYPDWFRMLIGAVEVGSALLLLIPRLRVVGCAGIVLVMLGAIHTHLMLELKPAVAAFCAAIAVLAVWLARASRVR